MLKSALVLLAGLTLSQITLADVQIPLLNEKACAKQIDKDLVDLYAGKPYQYAGGGSLSKVSFTGNVYSIIKFNTPGMGSDAIDEVVVKNEDCKVLSTTTIWAD